MTDKSEIIITEKKPKKKGSPRLASFASIGELWIKDLKEQKKIKSADKEILRAKFGKLTSLAKKRNSKVLSTRIKHNGKITPISKIIQDVITKDKKLKQLRKDSTGRGGAKIIYEQLKNKKEIKKVEKVLIKVTDIMTGLLELDELSEAEKATDSFRGVSTDEPKTEQDKKKDKILGILKKKPKQNTTPLFEKEQEKIANQFLKKLSIRKKKSDIDNILEEYIIEMESLADEHNIFLDSNQDIKFPNPFTKSLINIKFNELKSISKQFKLNIEVKSPEQIVEETRQKQEIILKKSILSEKEFLSLKQKEGDKIREERQSKIKATLSEKLSKFGGFVIGGVIDAVSSSLTGVSSVNQNRALNLVESIVKRDPKLAGQTKTLGSRIVELIGLGGQTDDQIIDKVLLDTRKNIYKDEILAVEKYSKRITTPSEEFLKIQNDFNTDDKTIRSLIDRTLNLASKAVLKGQKKKITEIKEQNRGIRKKFDGKLEELRIQSIIDFKNSNKPGIDFTLPHMNYAGPNTEFEKLVSLGIPGIHRIDEITKDHDSDYNNAKNPDDVRKADEKAVKNIKRVLREGIAYGVYPAGKATIEEDRDGTAIHIGLAGKIDLENIILLTTFGQVDPRMKLITIRRMNEEEIKTAQDKLKKEFLEFEPIIDKIGDLGFDLTTVEEQEELEKIKQDIKDLGKSGRLGSVVALSDKIGKVRQTIIEQEQDIDKQIDDGFEELIKNLESENPKIQRRINRDIKITDKFTRQQKIEFLKFYFKIRDKLNIEKDELLNITERLITSIAGLEPNELSKLEKIKEKDIDSEKDIIEQIEDFLESDEEEIISLKIPEREEPLFITQQREREVTEIDPKIEFAPNPPIINKDPIITARETALKEISGLFLNNQESIEEGTIDEAIGDIFSLLENPELADNFIRRYNILRQKGLQDDDLVKEADFLLVQIIEQGEEPPERFEGEDEPEKETEPDRKQLPIVIKTDIKQESDADPSQGREPLLRPEFIVLGSESVEEPKEVTLRDIEEWSNFDRLLQINPNSIQNPLWDDSRANLNLRFDEPLNRLVFKFKQSSIPESVSNKADIEIFMEDSIPQEQPFKSLFPPSSSSDKSKFTKELPSDSFKGGSFYKNF